MSWTKFLSVLCVTAHGRAGKCLQCFLNSHFLRQFIPFPGVHHITVLCPFFSVQLIALISFPVQPGWCCLMRFPPPPPFPTAKIKPSLFSLCMVSGMTAIEYSSLRQGAEKRLKLICGCLWLACYFVLAHAFISVILCVPDSHVPL